MSLKGDKYETLEEIQFRLNNTVVLYEDRPVYITRVGIPEADDKKEIARVYFTEMPYATGPKYDKYGDPIREAKPAAGEVRKYLSSKNFTLSPFKMGYFNHGGVATFASRVPVRQNQQGLSAKTLSLSLVKGGKTDLSFGKVVSSQGFVDSIAGIFPEFAAAGDLIGDEEASSVALSRQFALWIDHDLEALVLMHKNVKCGLALKGDKAIRIAPKFHFLRQEAEECRIPLA